MNSTPDVGISSVKRFIATSGMYAIQAYADGRVLLIGRVYDLDNDALKKIGFLMREASEEAREMLLD